MGTTILVRPSSALTIVKKCFENVDTTMSEWKNNSTITEINKNAGLSSVECPAMVCETVELSLLLAKQTGGAFDPTWACMWELWDFKNPSLPTQEKIEALLPLVNWEDVVVEGNTVRLEKEGMMLGLGAIAKGIALNDARAALLHEGFKNFMIVAGGQVVSQGNSISVGIRSPDGTLNEFAAEVTIQNSSISTSGDYENYFEVDGVRYHHIIDPRTGYPVQNGIRSVTVICEDAAVADALSTALFVMGAKPAIAYVDSVEGIEALIITENDGMLYSSNFAEFLNNANSVEGSSSTNLISAGD